jgi:hypothetical protein
MTPSPVHRRYADRAYRISQVRIARRPAGPHSGNSLSFWGAWHRAISAITVLRSTHAWYILLPRPAKF